MTIKFVDVSHYQGIYHPAGPVIAKATEGTTFVDEQFTATKGRTLTGGWPFAGYHFLRSGNIDAQAAHAFSVIGATPAMVDVETAGDGSWPTWAEFKAFVTAYRSLGGIVHLAYIPKWFWSGKWRSPSMAWLTDNGIALISSQYPAGGYTEDGPGWAPYGGVAPAIWQWTSTPIDTNAFKGTQDELGALFETGDTTVALTADDLTAIANKVWTYKPGWTGLLDETPLGMINDLRIVRDQMVAPIPDAQLDLIAAAVASKVVLGHDALTPDDLAGVEASVKAALREGVGAP